jgi:[ribosomal protein S5]-alanine N-acetyltransferase
MILETNRLILREITRADFPYLLKMLQDDRIMYAYEGAFTRDEIQGWLDKQLERYRDCGFGLWAVVLKETGIMIGQCGLTMQEYNGSTVIEVGYIFQKEYWHFGYATEAAMACKEYALEKLKAPIVYSLIRETNIPSQNVAKRMGMTCIDKFNKHYRGVDMPHLVFAAERRK